MRSERTKENDRKYRRNKKEASINAYGGKCACCGESHMAFLVIDHIENNGARHREEMGYLSHGRWIGSGTTMHSWLKRNGYPEGFQVLCANCNMAKQSLGICPHQMES